MEPDKPSLKSQRVAIFIDSANVQTSANKNGFAIHYGKLLNFALAGRTLIRSIAYLVKRNEEANIESLQGFLNCVGIESKVKDIIKRLDGSTKADWDMQLAIDALNIASKVDVIVIVSSDGDFMPLINDLKSKGVRVEVCAFKNNISHSLVKGSAELLPNEIKYLYQHNSGRDDVVMSKPK